MHVTGRHALGGKTCHCKHLEGERLFSYVSLKNSDSAWWGGQNHAKFVIWGAPPPCPPSRYMSDPIVVASLNLRGYDFSILFTDISCKVAICT